MSAGGKLYFSVLVGSLNHTLSTLYYCFIAEYQKFRGLKTTHSLVLLLLGSEVGISLDGFPALILTRCWENYLGSYPEDQRENTFISQWQKSILIVVCVRCPFLPFPCWLSGRGHPPSLSWNPSLCKSLLTFQPSDFPWGLSSAFQHQPKKVLGFEWLLL